MTTAQMPAWNCVDSDGPHCLAADGSCNWCGRSREQIAVSDNPVGGREWSASADSCPTGHGDVIDNSCTDCGAALE